ncbi:GNAT family N-acetyltransferase [Mesorhizobium sp. M4B.F.Ca.ET.215.01.1.1]|uniref:GNAT family N-acetyltransferase n=2 Tax=Mesorhizobium TaxID=68287 RepID=UPI000FC9B1C9|nr:MULTISPECIES: GNAT family N-acetyltransferase [unclassified Mesorhizobium]RUW22019.1 GNAT family N-acetyltransferase [Mesorhizobium sp. M4B.F.Ca.ET.013.02.1.1]RUW72209.1 GNAT family N-acetyltransferase [Mesorhizobium sp. M4B.F.Ca.ET.049.02.1.2]RVD30868.1 GNAT family N-acetyltransferase [Mesorhizobium sp. M4B.F.Ca.ET.017.02.2.1]RVD37621.1 GNAT family N-acetyltransferase [Mesorhizobium sp. M4B.F.Ca.ET.019.03.1.1]TGQ06138.1 GNAT family N-acetyltransferase [Mesorhizobium sp. M4B.F.Ca.ET.215.01.
MPAGGGPGLRVSPPERLTVGHDVSAFRNGRHPTLDDWLRNRALAGEGLSARTYVVCDANMNNRVIGYYAISTAMEERIALPSAKLRRGMPEQVPLLLIGRLAVDQAFQGLGLGGDLLADALRRCLAVSEIAGVRAVVAHAIDDDAVGFYQRHGFIPSPLGERVMLMPVETVQALFSKV